MTKPFPDTMDFAGFNQPSRVECDIYDLVIEGELPAEINGHWFRATPDPQYPPMLGEDTYLSGDGMVSCFRFENGHVDFKSRYVMTERLKAERAARRSLHGKYRNPFTDDPTVAHLIDRTVANTTPVWHGGKLLAIKEDGLPYELDPYTLETIGRYDFGGKLRSQTMSAHVRIDPETGEMFCYGYQAGGLASRDVAFCVISRDGELVREEWFQAPYAGLMHDFAVTREHIIFPVFPTIADKARIEAGGDFWRFEQEEKAYVGIMPRNGTVDQIRWFTQPACSSFHFMNAFTEGSKVHVDFGKSKCPPFPFILAASGMSFDPTTLRSAYVRWTFDLASPEDRVEERVIGPAGDFPRVADRDHMRDYRIAYYQTFDPKVGPPVIAGPVGVAFNTLMRLDVTTGEVQRYSPGRGKSIQEHIHIPSSQPDHEGYLAFVVDLHDTGLSEVQVLAAARPEEGPLARIQLPLRLRCQVHGNWVPASDLPLP